MRSRVLLILVAVLVLVVGLVFTGGQVLGCLGPLNVTEVQCIAAYMASTAPDYSPGPADGAWIVVALAMILSAIAILPWRRPSLRTASLLVVAGLAGAILGAVVYELTRETSLTGPTSSGRIVTVAFGPNAADRELHAAIGAGLALIMMAVTVSRRQPDTQ
jgi:hypothetical protein